MYSLYPKKKEKKTKGPRNKLFKGIYSSFIHNSQKLQTAQVLVETINKPSVVYSYKGTSLTNIKKQTTYAGNDVIKAHQHSASERNLPQRMHPL